MAVPLSLLPLITTYYNYFACDKSEPYKDHYTKGLIRYLIDIVNHASVIMPHDLGKHICVATYKGDPTTFLL